MAVMDGLKSTQYNYNIIIVILVKISFSNMKKNLKKITRIQ